MNKHDTNSPYTWCTGFNGEYNGQTAEAKDVAVPTAEEAKQCRIRRRIEALKEEECLKEELMEF